MEEVIQNNNLISQIITNLRKEIETVSNRLADQKLETLMKENEQLKKLIEQKQNQLVELEVETGRKQIPLPGKKIDQIINTNDSTKESQSSNKEPVGSTQAATKEAEPVRSNKKVEKPQKQKKPVQAAPVTESSNEDAVPEVSRLDLRIGKIVEVSKHPDATALYLEKIDVGEAQPRTVISGLVNFVPIEEMQNRLVVLLCNLKPAKMRGIVSEAMVLCASTPEKVEVLSPPSDSVPGDLVFVDGYPRQPDAQLNPKKKILETVLPDLKTNSNLEACYKDAKLIVKAKGPILAQTLKNVNVK